ncbi:Low molecular mass 30 kDa lipoprotein 19G1 [Eumeta japonica]|uniref:Low molecular mass 30 kDa lipoprotein 19G1 n=1 Tax=Eumeta variegata TaxID=151549 RepID=A0A4C1ZXI5_EUMVA|nr:Low molecular mass 30 kDa lipoprotein 19G1 [Eumeta japonica]
MARVWRVMSAFRPVSESSAGPFLFCQPTGGRVKDFPVVHYHIIRGAPASDVLFLPKRLKIYRPTPLSRAHVGATTTLIRAHSRTTAQCPPGCGATAAYSCFDKLTAHVHCFNMPSRSEWMWAKSPNYNNSLDKKYPYSEVPFLGAYKLIKIPPPNTLVELIDYWGEGRITADEGISGYVDSYNVNHEYQTVSNGPDRGRKIPNRIPVIGYTNCDTGAYIRNDSVANVTLMGAPINTSCAADVARMVSAAVGRVFVFGFDGNSADIENLEKALATKHLSYCPGYDMSSDLKSVTLFNSYRAYVNRRELEQQLYYNISSELYDDAVAVSQSLIRSDNTAVVAKVVDDCLKDGVKELIPYAYRLWQAGETDVVSEHFPMIFKSLFTSEAVRIVNAIHDVALKLDEHVDKDGDSALLGSGADRTSLRHGWVFVPVWRDGKTYFKIQNPERNMVLKLHFYTDSHGEKPAWGAPLSITEHRTYFELEAGLVNNDLAFFIKNVEFGLSLKLKPKEKDEDEWRVIGDASSAGGQPWRIQSLNRRPNSHTPEAGDTQEESAE